MRGSRRTGRCSRSTRPATRRSAAASPATSRGRGATATATPRDLLLGVTLVLADGTVASSGGKVVKNVAGYDLGKLVCGSRGRSRRSPGRACGCIRCRRRRRDVSPVDVDEPEEAGATRAHRRALALSRRACDLDWPGRLLAARFEGGEARRRAQVARAGDLAGGAARRRPRLGGGARACRRAFRPRIVSARRARRRSSPAEPSASSASASAPPTCPYEPEDPARSERSAWPSACARRWIPARCSYDELHELRSESDMVADCVHCGFCLPPARPTACGARRPTRRVGGSS